MPTSYTQQNDTIASREAMIPRDTIISRDAWRRLKIYQECLEAWQQKMNLVSASTLDRVWERHFVDSLQLLHHLPPEAKTLADLGSGAGFPGAVLAIARQGTLSVTLIEADLKKCVFLENVSREIMIPHGPIASREAMIPFFIRRARIENLKEMPRQDVITARALAPLSLLLAYAAPLLKEDGICLFLKGKDADAEILEAQKKWEFTLEIFPSLTDSKGKILKLRALKLKGPVPHV